MLDISPLPYTIIDTNKRIKSNRMKELIYMLLPFMMIYIFRGILKLPVMQSKIPPSDIQPYFLVFFKNLNI